MGYKRSKLMQRRLAENRQAILDSTRHLLSQGGFANALVHNIAEDAGISSGLVYQYFKNKNAILIETLQSATQKEVDVLSAIASSELKSEDKLYKAVRVFVKRALNNPRLAYALMFEPINSDLEYARFNCKELLKQQILKIVTQCLKHKHYSAGKLNTLALCIVGTMTYAVIEDLDGAQAQTVSTNHNTKIAEQVAQFSVAAIQAQQ
ncbi:TetR/AcrR family transcriptional regulator [Brackiella oedipodis]|uniref:TetR/AcrR family transcriptional regulator n=1 Tax=Brackiella oedipodis TaxID=124225 RepID=UPI00048A68CE|nr:TetR/AcrR family transcriptional regulator [Brackiella oedipodis]